MTPCLNFPDCRVRYRCARYAQITSTNGEPRRYETGEQCSGFVAAEKAEQKRLGFNGLPIQVEGTE
jgi:hypothetical protein